MVNRATLTQVWDDFAQGLLIVIHGGLGFLRDSLAVVGLLAAIVVGYVAHNDEARASLLAAIPFQADHEVASDNEIDNLVEAVREPALKVTNLLGLDDNGTVELSDTNTDTQLSKDQELVARFLSKR